MLGLYPISDFAIADSGSAFFPTLHNTAPTLPSFRGLGWSIKRAVNWQSERTQNISGKEVSKTRWSYPIYTWELVYNMLRQGTVEGVAQVEMQTLMGFFNALQGDAGSFLYQDQDDNAVTGQVLGSGDGNTTTFALKRAFGIEPLQPVLAPNTESTLTVYLDGAPQLVGTFYVTPWATTDSRGPGYLIFNTAPASGVAVTIDMSYYWPCRFVGDMCQFTKFLSGYYDLKKLTFQSWK